MLKQNKNEKYQYQRGVQERSVTPRFQVFERHLTFFHSNNLYYQLVHILASSLGKIFLVMNRTPRIDWPL